MAGSVLPAGGSAISGVARIVVVDSTGQRAEMAPNPFGNFFRHVHLEPPLEVSVFGRQGRIARMASAPHGDCNACHGIEGQAPPIGAPR